MHVTNKSRSLRTTRTIIRHPGNKLTSPTIEVKSHCNWLGLRLLGSGFRKVKQHLHGRLIDQRRTDILLKKILLPRMACLSTTVTPPTRNWIALCDGRPSVRVLVQLLIGRGYSVEVHLFPNNILLLVPAADRPFLFFFRGALLTVRERAGVPIVSSRVSESEESLTSAFGRSNNDSDAVDPDFPELGYNHW
jgi:hypothetical protein